MTDLDNAFVEKLRRVLSIANGEGPANGPVDVSEEAFGIRELVRQLERNVPGFWKLDAKILAKILENEKGRIVSRVMHKDARALGLEICRVRAEYEAWYEEPDHVESIRRKNTPFETLMEQEYPGCLWHALELVEQLRSLGFNVEYYQKRKPHAVERINGGIFVSLCGDGRDEIRLVEVSGSGHLICRSVETREFKPAFVKHVISLSGEFEVPLQFDHDEWLLTAAEMDSIVYNGGYTDIAEALARHPDFAPFVSVEISKVLSGRTDRWLGLVKLLLMDIEQIGQSGDLS